MDTQASITHLDLYGITRKARYLFASLPANTGGSKKLVQWLNETRSLLERHLPGTLKCRIAVSRIENAKRFLRSSETGAAKYEVSQMIVGLQEGTD